MKKQTNSKFSQNNAKNIPDNRKIQKKYDLRNFEVVNESLEKTRKIANSVKQNLPWVEMRVSIYDSQNLETFRSIWSILSVSCNDYDAIEILKIFLNAKTNVCKVEPFDAEEA